MKVKTKHDLDKKERALNTPFLAVDKVKFLHNIKRLNRILIRFNTHLRPHFKTIRSIEALPYLLTDKQSPITVSTIKEAQSLVEAGYTNVLYAVGIVEDKLDRIHALNKQGASVMVILDSLDQALSINRYCETNNCSIHVLIEIDCDGHRGGVAPNDPKLITIADTLNQGQGSFFGILTHAGESYHCADKTSLQQAAQNEVDQARLAAKKLLEHDIHCQVVSIGSTPTAHNYTELEGITEVRAGVYTFFDLVMTGIGVCNTNDIAATVVATVIGHNKEKGWLFIDAGWMALSADKGTAEQSKDCGYGLVANADGQLLSHMQVISANQEHGIVASATAQAINHDDFPIGTRLHILPNHACATTSMHTSYHVFDHLENTYETWNRIQGW